MNYEQLIIDHKPKTLLMLSFKGASKELAEDIYQDMFIKVKITLDTGKYFEQGKFLGWLDFIAKNMYIDYLRKKTRSKVYSMHYTYDEKGREKNVLSYKSNGEDNIEDQMIEEEIKSRRIKLAMKSVNKLCDSQKTVIDLYLFKSYKFKEIGEMLGVSTSAVIGRYRNAQIQISRNHALFI